MVRLKRLDKNMKYNDNIISQFHYGSIKTKKGVKMGYIKNYNLNSTMVRLKPLRCV